MENSLFEILVYLFHNYLEIQISATGAENNKESQSLSDCLEHIDLKFKHSVEDIPSTEHQSTRIYTADEKTKIQSSERGFMIMLEQLGLISLIERENILQHLMDSASSQISMEELKWTILECISNKADIPQTKFLESVLYSSQMRLH